MTGPQFRTDAPMGRKHRISPESAWPLRGVDGLTFAERRERDEKKMRKGRK